MQRLIARAGEAAGFPFLIHSQMLQRPPDFKLTNHGVDTRTIRGYLGILASCQHSAHRTSARPIQEPLEGLTAGPESAIHKVGGLFFLAADGCGGTPVDNGGPGPRRFGDRFAPVCDRGGIAYAAVNGLQGRPAVCQARCRGATSTTEEAKANKRPARAARQARPFSDATNMDGHELLSAHCIGPSRLSQVRGAR